MQPSDMIESAIEAQLARLDTKESPPGLTAAIRSAVVPGGARIRPRLCLATAMACGIDDLDLTLATATAIELLHCASLVHDDLPCFDDATTRRGRPSIHCSFGERLAVLAGDALIVMAFETLATVKTTHPDRIASLVQLVGRSVGAVSGITAGQAWECEADVDMDAYHCAKTGALFVGSAEAGAISAGSGLDGWRDFGQMLGLAYQTADDLKDSFGDATILGKPIGRDAALSRPSAVTSLGGAAAVTRVKTFVRRAIAAIPDVPGRSSLERVVMAETERILPKGIEFRAA